MPYEVNAAELRSIAQLCRKTGDFRCVAPGKPQAVFRRVGAHRHLVAAGRDSSERQMESLRANALAENVDSMGIKSIFYAFNDGLLELEVLRWRLPRPQQS
jgi:hypothetical protein